MTALVALGMLALFIGAIFFGWRIKRAFDTGVTWTTRYPNVRYQRGTETFPFWTTVALDGALSALFLVAGSFIALFLSFPACSHSALVQTILACKP